MGDGRTAAVICAYNEEKHIAEIVLQTAPHVDMVIVVDDGSVDATPQILAEIQQYLETLVVLMHPINQGKGIFGNRW